MIRSLLLAFACTLATTVAHAQMSEADLVTRIDHLEAQLRDLTGTVEQLQYRNHELEQEVQRLQGGGASAASPTRPTAQYTPPQSPYSPPPGQYPSSGQYPQPAATQYPPPQAPYSPPPGPVIANQEPSTGRRGDAFNPALDPNAPGAPHAMGSSTTATEPPPAPDMGGPGPRQPGAPLDLSTISTPSGGGGAGGDLPPPAAANTSATGAIAALPPGSPPKDEYDLAYSYIAHKDYGAAADTFRDFLHKYPSDRLTPEAQYWLGEALFQDQKYRDAAEAFLAVSTKYETTARAPDALLRLGESLAALGEKEAACASLGEVLRKYPRASLGVRQNVDRDQKRVHC